MNKEEILSHVDHTLLKAAASWEEIERLCSEAVRYGTAAVCVPPSYVKRACEAFGDRLRVCAVVGFPLGYNTTAVKIDELNAAKNDGACEFDMVVNLGDVKNGDFDKVTREIAAMKEAAGDNILKVIVETCYLTQEEKIDLCECVTKGKADYIKTSTGFGSGGAKMEDVLLFKKHIGPGVKIKASGGIRTKKDMVDFLEAGCERLGTSSAIKILYEENAL